LWGTGSETRLRSFSYKFTVKPSKKLTALDVTTKPIATTTDNFEQHLLDERKYHSLPEVYLLKRKTRRGPEGIHLVHLLSE
jgi:hypothetical protein